MKESTKQIIINAVVEQYEQQVNFIFLIRDKVFHYKGEIAQSATPGVQSPYEEFYRMQLKAWENQLHSAEIKLAEIAEALVTVKNL